MSKRSQTESPPRAAIAPPGRPERRNAVTVKPRAPATKRGAQTREKIKEGAAQVLERIGYRAMRIQDIAAEAGVNVSHVYHYFAGKADITQEILTDLLDSRASEMPRAGEQTGDAFDVLLEANRALTSIYATTPGLMRCLMHFDEEEAEFSQIYRRVSLDWNRRIARDIARRVPDANLGEGRRLMVAYALGGMVDDFLFEMYVDRNPHFAEELKSQEDAARFLAVLWHRTLYLSDPSPAQMGKFADLSKLRLPS